MRLAPLPLTPPPTNQRRLQLSAPLQPAHQSTTTSAYTSAYTSAHIDTASSSTEPAANVGSSSNAESTSLDVSPQLASSPPDDDDDFDFVASLRAVAERAKQRYANGRPELTAEEETEKRKRMRAHHEMAS